MEKNGYIVDNFLLLTGTQVYHQENEETGEGEKDNEETGGKENK